MKNFLIFIILILVFGGWWLTKTKNKPVVDESITSYKNSGLGITFDYPKILTISASDEMVTLHHDIPYQNHGECDMMGDENVYPRLTDFRVTFQKIEKNLVDTMRIISPYIPQENFVNEEVVESPGFIDKFQIGKLDGYAIYEGVEGCGQTTYYFRIKDNQTLVVGKASIQILSGVIVKEKMEEVLAVPGVISREKSEEMFESILTSLKI